MVRTRRKPDLLFVLVIILTAGVILTSLEGFFTGMDAQAFPVATSKAQTWK